MLADDMQKAEAKGRRLYTDQEITEAVGTVYADAIATHGAGDKDAIISEIMGELVAMTRALRDAHHEIRDTDERIGKTLALLTNASNVLTRKD